MNISCFGEHSIARSCARRRQRRLGLRAAAGTAAAGKEVGGGGKDQMDQFVGLEMGIDGDTDVIG